MAATDKQYVSAISLLDTRQILHKVVDIQNTVGLTDVMGLLGRYVETTQAIFHSYTNSSLWAPVTINTVDAGSGTASVTCTLTAGTSGTIRVNDECRAPDGTVLDVNSVSGSPDQVVFKTVDGGNYTPAPNDVIYVFSNSVGEQSISRTNQKRGLNKNYQLIQAFRESDVSTDIQRMSPIEVSYNGKPYFYVKDYIEKFLKHKAEVNAAAIASNVSVSQFTTSTNALTDPQGGGIKQYCRGLDQYITTRGVDHTAGTLGSFSATDLGATIDLLLAKKAELNFLMFGANGAVRLWDNYWKGLGSSGITSGRLNVDGSDLNLEVEKVSYSNADIQKIKVPIMDETTLMPADLRKFLYFVPAGKVKAQTEDGKGFLGDQISMRYMKHPIAAGANSRNAGNDIWAEWHSGAASPVNPVGETLNAVCNWVTYQAPEVLAAEHFARLKVIS